MRKTILLLIYSLIFSVLGRAQIPAGYYYIADGKKKAELKSYLSAIILQAQMLSYGSGEGATWQGFYSTDRNSANNSVVDMYSPTVRYFSENYGSVSGMHIEHSLPKSWWGGRQNNAYKDLFHLYPADGQANIIKNNLPMGEVGSASFNNGVTKVGANNFSYYLGKVFEPADDFKGDFARSYMYMVTAYENFGSESNHYWNSPMINNNTYPVWQKWAIDLLLKWHRQDPVSQKERLRQEAVFQIQGNRNPFIDYPNLVEYIWGVDTNKIYHFPAETQPFMIQPNRWTKIDFGVVMQGNNEGQTFIVSGKNLAGDINLSIKNASYALELSQSTVTAQQANNSRTINIWLNAQTSGSVIDTVVISGGGLVNSIFIPINAVVSPDFMALKATNITSTTAQSNFMKIQDQISDPVAYTIKVWKQTSKSANLFFSGYIEGSSNNKALVLYNNTGKSVDLSKFSIKKQTNGTSGFKDDLQLSGSLANGQKYVIVNSQASQSLLNIADKTVYASQNQATVMNFNGNDAVALYHNNVQIDIVGIVDEMENWGMDLTLQRKPEIIHPKTDFSFDEWNILPTDNFSPASSHSVSTFSDIIQNTYSGTNQNNWFPLPNLIPETQYIYEVIAVKQNFRDTTANRAVFCTSALETPVAYEASVVDETSFTANWEDVQSANGYFLNVYQIAHGETESETEHFDGISGTGVPSGWTGKVGTAYTSTANSGQSLPSIGLKANNDWLQTKIYPAPVTELSFWYKFPTGANSNIVIWGNNGDEEWFELDTIYQQNTAASNDALNFDREDNFTAFKFVLNKPSGGGNLAIDDVSATYITYDTTYREQNRNVAGNFYNVKNLVLGDTYYYRVKSYFQGLESNLSNEIAVKTHTPTALPYIADNQIFAYATKEGIFINDVENGSEISIYTITGISVYKKTAKSDHIFFPILQKGIFIIGIKSKKGYFIKKIVK
ncbi:MAG: endonuclease [Prevotellaceae bacterium]|jgi:endonuclease I|nr:endonuclease [Prevotellaceae bacterium]